MYGTLNFTVTYIVADVDPVYGEMICQNKNQETLEAKLVCLCGGLRERGGETAYLAELCGPISEISSTTSKKLSEICMGNEMVTSEIEK